MTTRARGVAMLCVAVATALMAAGAALPSPGTSLISGIPQRGTVLGERTATVTLILFEDFGCKHCRAFTQSAFPAIVREYVRPGDVKIDFRGLGVVTRPSEPALRYALAASRQRKLWQLAALFYENQARLNDVTTERGIRRLTRGIRDLDVARLIADARSRFVLRQVDAHAAEAKRRDVPGTPWFFIKVGTAAPELVRPEAYDGDSFRAILDAALGRR